MTEESKPAAGLAELRAPRAIAPTHISAFSSLESFEAVQRMANLLAASAMVPKAFQKNLANCVVALELAQRTNSSVLAVMQGVNIIHGRPSWSAQFIAGVINSSGRFDGPVEYVYEGGDKRIRVQCKLFESDWSGGEKTTRVVEVDETVSDLTCYARAPRGFIQGPGGQKSPQFVTGPKVSMELAVREGWYTRSGSKWRSMSDMMLAYRAVTFFGRLHVPDLLAGMKEVEEIGDTIDGDFVEIPAQVVKPAKPAAKPADKAQPPDDRAEEEAEGAAQAKAQAAPAKPVDASGFKLE